MSERTGYWVGEATGETSDDNPDGYCAADYDLCVVVRDGRPLDMGCARTPGHDGDHWDETYGIFWRGQPVDHDRYVQVRVMGEVEK